MGIENTNNNAPYSDDALKSIGDAYPGYGMSGYATNQFWGLTHSEPYGIDRNNFDNPPFLWPAKQYMDSTGTTHKVQRGYMRSLLSDPEVNATMKNRRLFFQFNPSSLVRTVQQSVGSMMPLLQDPAQLMQPVPGTASFGFELMFNREHEVNAGYNDPNTDWLTLPDSGRQALVSEIGVLADLMILDTITGQGLSQDMIASLASRTKKQYDNLNTINANTKTDLEKAGKKEEAKDYQPIPVPEDTDMAEIFTANIGNTAFLNPLPFRVLFSSLFMVEGVATSVDVKFEKFSRNMVPTQCRVTINMYALYIGFSKKKTFIYDNLIQSAEDIEEQEESDAVVKSALETGIRSLENELYLLGNRTNIYLKLSYKSTTGTVSRTSSEGIFYPWFIEKLNKKEFQNTKVQVFLEYYFGDITTKPTEAQLTSSRIQLTTSDEEIEMSVTNGKELINETWTSSDLKSSLKTELDKLEESSIIYISFRTVVKITTTNKDTNLSSTIDIVGSTVYNRPVVTNFGTTTGLGTSSYSRTFVYNRGR